MRRKVLLAVISVQVLLLSGCAAAWQSATYSDDLYTVHNKIAIANRQKAEAELAKAQYEAEQAQYEAALAKINAEAAKQGTSGSYNSFDAVLADSYESAYARRLYGFSSPTYHMPSSYYTLRYSAAFFYASAYDPAFYNVMVSGDMVWVEPKYVTSMFGSWGAVVVPTYGWYYGWNDPYYYWNRSYRYDWYYGWNSPYYWGWGYPYSYYHHYCYGHHYNYHHSHHYPHRPSYGRPSHNRPPYAGSGSVGNTGHHNNRPGSSVGRNPGASQPADRGGYTRPSTPSVGRATQPTYRGGATAVSGGHNNGSSSYRNGSSSSNSSGSSSSYRSGSSSGSSSSYRSSGSSSSSRSYSSGSGGGSHSYSGGGNSRGR